MTTISAWQRCCWNAALGLWGLTLCAAAGPIEVIYTEIPGQPTAVVPGAKDPSGNPVFAEFTALGEIALRGDGGEWMLKATTNLGASLDAILILGSDTVGNAFAQDGQVVQGGLPGELYDFFDSPVPAVWNDSGDIAFSFRARGGSPSIFEKVVVVSGGVHTVVIKMGDAALGLIDQPPNPTGDELFGNSINSVHILNTGQVGFVCTPIQNCHSNRYPAFFYDNTSFRQSGVSWIEGEVWDNFDYDDCGGSPDGHWFAKGDTENPNTAIDNILAVDDVVVLREGSPVGGSSVTMATILFTRMLSGGTWFCRGDDPSGNDWAVGSSVLLAKTGDAITPTEHWGNSFLAFNGNNVGDWVLAGNTDNPDPNHDNVLVLNGSEIVMREDDPVDVDGNGLFDDDAYLATFQANDLFITDTKMLYLLVSLRNAAGTNIGDAFIRKQVGGSLAACCYLDGTCALTTEAECTGVWHAEWTSCEPNLCPQPTGACCLAGSNCQALSATECDAAAGTYQGDGTTCDPDPCGCFGDMNCDGAVTPLDIDFFVLALMCWNGDPSCWPYDCPWLNGDMNLDGNVNFLDVSAFEGIVGSNCPTGSCSYPGGCDTMDAESCADIPGGSFTPNVFCAADPHGACCVGGLCVGTMGELRCVYHFGGRWYPAEDCLSGFACPGACCVDSVCVGDMAKVQCDAEQGDWYGGEFCDMGYACLPLTGACCVNDVCVGTMSQAACDLQAGQWYAGEDCAAFQCSHKGACCISHWTCIITGEAGCAVAGGEFHGAGTDCFHQEISAPCHASDTAYHCVYTLLRCPDAGGKRADCVDGPPMFDPWTTQYGTRHDFGGAGQAIPADFFGPGSAPYTGEVWFKPVPLGPVDLTAYGFGPAEDFGDADTLIWRADDPFDRCVLPPAFPSDPVPVEIKIIAIHLESIAPIEVEGMGAPIEAAKLWNVSMFLSPTAAPASGTLTATKTHCNGGTYVISGLEVPVLFVFTKVTDPSQVRELDTAAWGIPPVTLNLPADSWVHDVDEALETGNPVCTDFHAALAEGAARETTQCDCNANGIRDACDIAGGTSYDCNRNGLPDECEGPPVCRGDMDCDGQIGFGDINPFVLYLSNNALWQTTYAGCNPVNGDINQDGTYGEASFGDINPFVALLSGGF